MNIATEYKNNNLYINGLNLGEYNEQDLKQLVIDLDHIAHHKHNIQDTIKDHFKINIRDIDLGQWEVSQIRQVIETIDRI